VAGGGTGGHALAGVAIADAWMEADRSARVVFVGAKGGIEEKVVPRAGYPLILLNLGSLKRVSIGRRLKTLVQLPLSMLKSAEVLVRERPVAVVGVGGYASGPLVLVARLIGWVWGAQVAIVEQNSVPGFTNRVLGHFAHRIFLAFPGVESQFPAGKAVLTGNPIRNTLKPMAPARPGPFTIFIFGGSQGSMPINSLIIESLPFFAKLPENLRSRIHFIHQTGEKDFDRVNEAHQMAGSRARVEKFIYEMPAAYAESSLLICRSGSSTMAEIAAVGRASILIPFPFAADNHQESNARLFSDAGAARLLIQFNTRGEDLVKAVKELMDDPAEIASMELKVRPFYRPNAAKDVVALLRKPTGSDPR